MKNKLLKNRNLNFEKVTISKLKQTSVKGGADNGKTDMVNVRPTEAGETCMCTWNNAFGG
jgi:hypothetical protein